MKNTNSQSARKTGIWIDSSKAVLVTFQDNKPEIEEIAALIENRVHHEGEGDKGSFGGARHGDKGSFAGALRLDNNKKFDERRQHQVTHFLDAVLEKIRPADEIAILGPAQMKNKLHTRVLETANYNPRIKAMDASGKLTSNQLVKRFKEIFENENTSGQ